MTKDNETEKNLADRLLEVEESEGAPRSARPRDQLLLEMIERERLFEERVRRLAKLGWSVTFATLPLASLLAFLIKTGGGSSVDVLRVLLIVAGAIGILSLFGAILTSVAWLFRSNSPKLAAIERRLVALEELLMARGRDSL